MEEINNNQMDATNNNQPTEVNNNQLGATNNNQPEVNNTNQPEISSSNQPATASNNQPELNNTNQPAEANNNQTEKANNNHPISAQAQQEEIERQFKIEELNRRLLKEDKKSSSGWKGIWGAIFLALFIRSFFFEPYNIPSSSMVPTLLVGDYLFITKFDYGYSKHSFPFSVPLIPRGRIFANMPQRGDIVIFKKPPENDTDYIKRIIGLPGDTIQMRNGRLYINGEMVHREEKGHETWSTEVGEHLYTRYTETLPNGVSHDIYELTDEAEADNTDPIVVPEKTFFMMGDNRDNSLDSRYFGPVPFVNLEGKARLIFYSNNGGGWFFEFWHWKDFLRLERFFTNIT